MDISKRKYNELVRMFSMELDDIKFRETIIEKGEARKNYENARRMKEEGLSFDIISRVTGLDLEEIQRF